MSSRSTTPSEGEIVESDSQKATSPLPSFNGNSVDRHSRPRISISRSPSPYRASRRPRSQPRSRSPYREPRGAKRPREDDHRDRQGRNDPRRFRVHYEGQEKPIIGRSSYHQPDNNTSPATRSRHEEERPSRSHREKRPRTLSRSPHRFVDKKPTSLQHDDKQKGGRPGDYGKDSRSDHRYRESYQGLSKEQSVSDWGHTPVAAAYSKREAEFQKNQKQQHIPSRLHATDATDNSARQSGPIDSSNVDELTAKAPLDEAALIEERRKKREAIKAKYKGQATPMLVKALAIGSESKPETPDSETPRTSSHLASPARSPPQTPKDISGQDSPNTFNLAKDEDLANGNDQVTEEPREDEPSAADYDPTIDMQEDKIRHDQRHRDQEVSSGAYDETQNNKQDVLIPEATIERPVPQKTKDEFDMFADADDEDMFAQTSSVHHNPSKSENRTIPVPVPQAKALDMSMLDDWDDPEGYYKILLGELLDKRYHVQSNLGKGMFSGVVRALDQHTSKLVAIKIIRSNETMRKAGLQEIQILQTLMAADPEDKKHIIRLERSFEHKSHLCMVFENQSINLREVLKKFGRDVGINLKAVRVYAQQMFLGLSLLRKCNILHADLKPDNVLVNESRNGLKICDLGSASSTLESDTTNEVTEYLVSRFYRAPEIMLGYVPYDHGIDIWSIGCTLFELYTGKILFTGRNNNAMLRSIMECRGKFGHKFLRKAQLAGRHFDDLLNFRSVEIDRVTGKDVVRILNFTKPSRDLRTRLLASANNNAKGMADADLKDLNLFLDLLERCLALNPEKRCTPAEALRHPFLMRSK